MHFLEVGKWACRALSGSQKMSVPCIFWKSESEHAVHFLEVESVAELVDGGLSFIQVSK